MSNEPADEQDMDDIAPIYRTWGDGHSSRSRNRRNRRNPVWLPMPGRRNRTLTRWLLFAANVLPFALIIFFYNGLSDAIPSVFDSNLTRIAIPIWALILLLHLLIVGLMDVREGWIFARRDRRAHQQFQTEQKRQRLMQQLYGVPPADDATSS